jgi:PAS domain S-box-containing protein
MSERIVKPQEEEMFPVPLNSSGRLSANAIRFAGTAVATARAGDERPEVSEKFLQDLVEACASNIALLDESGAILYASRAWTIFEQNHRFTRSRNQPPIYFGFYRGDQDAGSDSTNRFARPTLSEDLGQLLVDTVKEINGKYNYSGITGAHSLLVHAARLDLPQSRFRILVSHDDLVTPKEALRRSEERLSQLLETTNIVAWEADPETWRFTYVSAQAREFLGYSMPAWYAPDFLVSNIHADDRDRVIEVCTSQSQAADSFDITFRMLASDGTVMWIHNLVSITRAAGRTVGVHGFMIDITEQKRIQEVLRDLGSRLIAAQEKERSRVARELHDDLNQRMALLSIELEQLTADAKSPRALRRHVHKLQDSVQEIAADIHRLSYRLHPSKLDHLGLAPAVESLCKELSSDKLTVIFHQTGFPAPLSQDVTLCLFRIAQEALRNTVKHSDAPVARVDLERSEQEVRLSITDDGCGFDMESSAMRQGLGFTSMRERLRLLDGRIEIKSRPGQGASIKVSVPLGSSQ